MKINIQKTWTKEVKAFLNEFLKQTNYQDVVTSYNGFIGVGTLKEKESHGEAERVNEIVMMWYLTFKKAPDNFDRIAMTKGEAQQLSLFLNNMAEHL